MQVIQQQAKALAGDRRTLPALAGKLVGLQAKLVCSSLCQLGQCGSKVASGRRMPVAGCNVGFRPLQRDCRSVIQHCSPCSETMRGILSARTPGRGGIYTERLCVRTPDLDRSWFLGCRQEVMPFSGLQISSISDRMVNHAEAQALCRRRR